MTRGFNLDCALICDDIRTEVNGKAILIGVYSGDIVLPDMAANLGLSVWLQGRAEEAARKIGVRIEVVSGSSQVSSGGMPPNEEFKVEAGDNFLIAVGKIPVRILGEGHISLQIKFGDRDWTELISKRIVIAAHTAQLIPPLE